MPCQCHHPPTLPHPAALSSDTHGTAHVGHARIQFNAIHEGRGAIPCTGGTPDVTLSTGLLRPPGSTFFVLRPVSHILGREGGREIDIARFL